MTKTRGAMALPLLLLLTAASAFAAAYPPLQLPAFTLSDLQTPDAATVQRVGDAITQLGMFAVTGLQADEVAHDALSQFVPCAMSGNVKLRDVTMDNGATRRTLATATNASVPQPLPADALTHCPAFASAAYRLRSAVAAAGAAYAGVLDTLLYGSDACASADTCFVGAVREAESLEHFHLFEPPAPKASATTTAAATAVASSSAKEHMLAMHSDIGLFLVMTPAELFDRMDKATAAPSSSSRLVSAAADSSTASAAKPAAARRSQDLVVQLADGSVVTPVLPDGALLVMNGEGLTRWMRMPAGSGTARKPLPYSPLHEVLSSDMNGGVRAWFGRMFMPLRSATLQPAAVADVETQALLLQSKAGKAAEYGRHAISVSNAVRQDDGDDEYEDDVDGEDEAVQQQEQGVGVLTFGEYRQHTYAAFNAGQGHVVSAAGCSPTRRLLVDEGSCGADEVFCWHSCMKIAASNLTCTKSEAVCANAQNTSMLWPRDYTPPGSSSPGHCKDCTVMCPAKDGGPPVLPPSRSSFCNTNLGPTTMWMTGFQFAKGNENDPCVVYLFPEWVLDTHGKFAGACIGTFLLGLVVGALGALRTRLKDRWAAEGLWAPDYEPQWCTWTADATIILIIAVQVCLGYWLMLVAMTYQAELFIMVVLGLACGHLFYRTGSGRSTAYAAGDDAAAGGKGGDNYEAGEKLEPCCSV